MKTLLISLFLFSITLNSQASESKNETNPSSDEIESCIEEQYELHLENLDTYKTQKEGEDFLNEAIQDCKSGN